MPCRHYLFGPPLFFLLSAQSRPLPLATEIYLPPAPPFLPTFASQPYQGREKNIPKHPFPLPAHHPFRSARHSHREPICPVFMPLLVEVLPRNPTYRLCSGIYYRRSPPSFVLVFRSCASPGVRCRFWRMHARVVRRAEV